MIKRQSDPILPKRRANSSRVLSVDIGICVSCKEIAMVNMDELCFYCWRERENAKKTSLAHKTP